MENELKLSSKLYNEGWYSCFINPMLGLLIDQDNRFKSVPCYFTFRYVQEVIDLTNIKPERLKKFFERGWILLNCAPVNARSIVHSYFDVTEIRTIERQKLNKEVKEYLSDGYYVFVRLNRAFFPNSKDDITHRSFFYGYNDKTEVFYLIEDIKSPGKQEYITLPYQAFLLSLEHVPDDKLSVLLVKKKNLSFNDDVDLLVSNLIAQKEESIGYREDMSYMHYQYGFSAIDYFVDKFYDIAPFVEFQDHLTKIVTYQKRNLNLIDYLYELKLITLEKRNYFNEQYFNLYTSWEIIKNTVQKNIIRKNMNCTDSYNTFNGIDKHLQIVKKEQDIFNQLITIIS
jgi:hypothetical protein